MAHNNLNLFQNPYQTHFQNISYPSAPFIPGNGVSQSIQPFYNAAQQQLSANIPTQPEATSQQQPSEGFPGGLRCGGANFYSVEFAEKLSRSLPFMKSVPRKSFLNDWKSDTEILQKQGVTLNVHVKQEPEVDDAADVGQDVNDFEEMNSEKFGENNSKENITYSCSLCNKMFTHLNLLGHHYKTCQKVIETEQNFGELNDSTKMPQTTSKKWRCLVCEKVLSNFESLRRHFRLLHREKNPRMESAPVKQEESEVAQNEAKNEDLTLSGSEDSRTRKRKQQFFKCDYCDKKSTRSHDLKRHIQRIHFVCTDCSAAFKNQAQVYEHLAECSMVNRYKKVNQGQPIHLGQAEDENAQGVINSSEFSDRDAVAQFVQIDPDTIIDEEKGEQYVSSSNRYEPSGTEPALNLISDTEHQKDTDVSGKLKCHSCMKFYSNEFALRRHVEGVHLKAYTCQRCRQSFVCKSKLKKHLQICSNRVFKPFKHTDDQKSSSGYQGLVLRDQKVVISPGDQKQDVYSTVDLGTKEDKSRNSDWTSTPFPTRSWYQNNQDPEFSPIFQSNKAPKSNLDYSAISQNDSGFQINNDAITTNFSGVNSELNIEPNPVLIQIPTAQSQLYHSPVAITEMTSFPQDLIKNKQLTITKIQNSSPEEVKKVEDSNTDQLAVARTIIFLRTLQLARLRAMMMQHQSMNGPEISQPHGNENLETAQNSSVQPDTDSGNGSNQNSDTDPKFEPEQNQNSLLDNLDVTPKVVKNKKKSVKENSESFSVEATSAEQPPRLPYQCQQCPKTFSRKDGLARHVEAIHLNIKHTCTDCGLAFKNKFRLDDHVKGIHERSQLFNCKDCERVFELKAQLYRHNHSAHSTQKRWICNICENDFKTKHGLDRHKENQH